MDRKKEGLLGGTDLRLGEKTLETVRESQEILKILIESKESGKSIAISSPVTGEGFVITAVDDIILVDGATIVLLKPFDITGFMLPVNRLKLSDIRAACPLESEFGNPVLKNLNKQKTWYF